MEALFDSSGSETVPAGAGKPVPRRADSLLAENLRLKEIISQQQKQLDAMMARKGVQDLPRSREPALKEKQSLAPVSGKECVANEDKILMSILALAEKCCLCTGSQIRMMLDYVCTGRFKAQYYIEMWSKRLQKHSPKAAAQLRDVLEGRTFPPDVESVGHVGRDSIQTQKAQEVRRHPGIAVESVKSEPKEDWEDAPREILRRATRTFRHDGDESVDPDGAWRAVGSGLVELAGSKIGAKQSPFRVQQDLYTRLRPYQRNGVSWMVQLYQAGQGGILADEMGLGKTVQACTLLSGIRQAGATHALILLPPTLLEQWEEEAETWSPGWPVYTYFGSTSQRARALRGVMSKRGGVLLTSYSVLKYAAEELLQVEISDVPDEVASLGGSLKRRRCAEDATHPSYQCDAQMATRGHQAPDPIRKPWDLILCDEAHVMRNISTLLGRSLRNIHAHCRILLTGTPVQNSLQDLWALMDFAQPGLLGNHGCFVKNFSNPIDKGSVRDASPYAIELKRHLCEQLWALVKPHMLRRTKESVGLLADAGGGAQSESLLNSTLVPGVEKSPLPHKTETVVWLTPAKEQVDAYRKLLEKSEVVKEATVKGNGLEVFKAIALLKRLCNHPSLGLPFQAPGAWQEFLSEADGTIAKLTPLGKRKAGLAPPAQEGDAKAEEEASEKATVEAELQEEVRAGRAVEMMLRKLPRDLESLVSQSAKLRCLEKLLPALASRGHRTLVFLQGLKMMDLVEICILKPLGLTYLRIDGQTNTQSRGERVRSFQNKDDNINFMLLTTRVGGYGLNLTAADRVVIVDPNWNPAVDAQAVDRAYRIGQTQEVKVYRLVLSGLVEDKIFRLQVFKMGLTKTALDAKQQHRYFTGDEIRNLFAWTDPAQGETRKMLLEKHSEASEAAINASAQADGADEGWYAAGPVAGLSDFSLLYSSLASEEADAEGACQVKMADMKDQLCKADQQTKKTAEDRQALEERLKSSHAGIADATEKIGLATSERLRASELLKQKQSQLTQARRQEAATEQRLEKTMRARALASEQVLNAEQAHSQAKDALTSAIQAAGEAREAVRIAEAELPKAVAGVRETFALFSEDGKAVGGNILDGTAGKFKSAQRAFERFCKALEGVHISKAAWQSAEDALMNCSDKDCTKMEALREKTRQRLETTCESTAHASASLLEAGYTFTDCLQGARDQAVSATRVKAGQQAVKSSFRQASTIWQKAKHSLESLMKAAVSHSRSIQKESSTAGALAEMRTRLESAERDHREAVLSEETCRAARATLTKEVAAADAARHAAEVEEVSQKRRKAECKSTLSAAREALRPARAAEKQAAVERTALLNHYSKSERGHIKEELSAAKSSAQDALSAVMALKGEAYDANQVEEAYQAQAKKKQKVEACEES